MSPTRLRGNWWRTTSGCGNGIDQDTTRSSGPGGALQNLRQVLRERRTRQHHIAARFLGSLLEFALDMGNVADETDPVESRVRFEGPDELQRIDAGAVQVEDNDGGVRGGLVE